MPTEAQPYVYIKSSDHAWVPCRVLKKDAKTATVAVPKFKDEAEMLVNTGKTSGVTVDEKVVKLSDYENGVLPMQNVDDRGKLADHEDQVNLPYLHEAAILYNIKARHMKEKPYTRTGDLVVAVNPYQWITDLYTEKKRKYYAQKLVWDNAESDPRTDLAPHVYEASALSYKGMAFDGENQSILVSGESGAGKTETVKICMNHIASVQEGPSGSYSGTSAVVQRVLDSNPLLEAFGNAKTRRNDNSSRFGKYLQLQFDHAGGIGRNVAKLVGSRAEVYLLEKNRVIGHSSLERTFHIFYQILAAPDSVKAGIWEGLKGTNYDSFKYVGHTDTNKIEGLSDAEHFQKTVEVLKEIRLGDDDIRTFMRAICITLQFGNLAYAAKGGDHDKSTISNTNELAALAKLMGVPQDELSLCLTERTMKTKDETYKVPLNTDAAKESADAMAKEIYGKVFLWLVKAINRATCAEENGVIKKGQNVGIVGLLDIFGFESFDVNRFEQLCINYANEKLQQKFTADIFKSVLEEYKFEGIPLDDIKYEDNQDVLHLIEDRTGLCALLNEECVRPKGSGAGFVNKALASNKGSPCLLPHRTDQLSFGVMHYAGSVYYDATDFVKANMDTLPTDLEDCATKASNTIIANAFNYQKYHAAATKNRPTRAKSNIMAPTVWTKYKGQLSSLMKNLYATHSRYIRCIKPNTKKQPKIMEHMTTVEQLRCAGIVAGVTISRSAFPNKLNNSQAYARYNSMWDKNAYPAAPSGNTVQERVRADCVAVLTCALKEKEKTENGKVIKAFVVGKTRTYFRAGALEFLESHRVTGLDAQAVVIQKAARGWLVRRNMAFSPKARKEAEEAARREEEERMERLKREQEELEAEFQSKIAVHKKEIAALKAQIEREDNLAKTELDGFQQTNAKYEEERDHLVAEAQRVKEDTVMSHKREMERAAKKLESNMGLIHELKKDNKKIHKDFEKDEKKVKDLSGNNKKINKTAAASDIAFEELSSEMDYVMSVNERLIEELEASKEDNAHMKNQTRDAQIKYMGFAECRLELQKTLASILTTIDSTCKDKDLRERSFAIAHECEAQSKRIMAEVEDMDF